jgi:hypothetical protein
MENIKIPSPSTILDSPDIIPAARGKPASPPKRAKQIGTAAQKPKQTKSRNGTILLASISIVDSAPGPIYVRRLLTRSIRIAQVASPARRSG